MFLLNRLLPRPLQPAPSPENIDTRTFYYPPDADPDYQPTSLDDIDSDLDDIDLFPAPSLSRPPPPMRLALTPRPHVYGFPPRCPHGGALVLAGPAPADLEFLGLPAIPAAEIPPLAGPGSADEEEAFCERMRLLGAQWWKGGEAERRRAALMRARSPDRLDLGGLRTVELVAVGFEGVAGARGALEQGGVWVYRDRWAERQQERDRRREHRWREDGQRGPSGVDREARMRECRARRRERREELRRIARVSAARTMDERCTVIRECGGEYFESVEAWRKVVMEEHVREGVIAPDRDMLFRKTYDDGDFL
ncbi:hypothetical protein B0J12DRAFT_688022 [Macrophomina phaseolina]|uniref:Uncharacterized protein n=1 Tax=Macrophomina phaseolina TaxID=35725 RepID=A0ABQ8FS40_9PEZI|nr:hypothetical protein B0J12DRAFT_688022 [Macrophomina phaseolina]